MTDAEERLTIREISRRTGIPESTLRYYRSLFPEFIPTVGRGRQRRHPADAVKAFRRIADLFAAGHSRDAVRRHLASPSPDSEAPPPHDPAPVSAYRGLEVARRYEIERVDHLERGDLEGILSAVLMRDRELMAMQRELLNLVEHLVAVFGSLASREAERGGRWERALPETIGRAEVDRSDRSAGAEASGEPEDEGELQRLRDSLHRERAMVERLRQARLELEQRLARIERDRDAGRAD